MNEFGYATPIFREKLLKDLHGVSDRKHAEAYESLDQDLLAVAVESRPQRWLVCRRMVAGTKLPTGLPVNWSVVWVLGELCQRVDPTSLEPAMTQNCRNLRRHLPTAMEVLPNQLAAHRQLIGTSCFTGTCLKFKQIARGGGENERPLAGHLRACSWGRGGGGGSTQNDPHDKVSDLQLTSDMWRGKFVEWLL